MATLAELFADLGIAGLFAVPQNIHGVAMARMKCNAAILQYNAGLYELVPIGRDNVTYVRGTQVYGRDHGDMARLQYDVVQLHQAT